MNLRFDVNGKELVAEVPSVQYDAAGLSRGQQVTLGWNGDQLVALDD